MVTQTKQRSRGQIASQKKAVKSRKENGHQKEKAANGHFLPGESFSIEAFIARIGTTRSGLLAMRRRGLKARMDGKKRVMITSDDYLEYLKSQPVAELNEAS